MAVPRRCGRPRGGSVSGSALAVPAPHATRCRKSRSSCSRSSRSCRSILHRCRAWGGDTALAWGCPAAQDHGEKEQVPSAWGRATHRMAQVETAQRSWVRCGCGCLAPPVPTAPPTMPGPPPAARAPWPGPTAARCCARHALPEQRLHRRDGAGTGLSAPLHPPPPHMATAPTRTLGPGTWPLSGAGPVPRHAHGPYLCHAPSCARPYLRGRCTQPRDTLTCPRRSPRHVPSCAPHAAPGLHPPGTCHAPSLHPACVTLHHHAPTLQQPAPTLHPTCTCPAPTMRPARTHDLPTPHPPRTHPVPPAPRGRAGAGASCARAQCRCEVCACTR